MSLYKGYRQEPDSGAGQLLRSFHLNGQPLPPQKAALAECVVFLNENTPLILTPVTLEKNWHETSCLPILAQDQEGGVCALLPNWRGKYYMFDSGTRRRIYLSRSNCGRFQREAFCAACDFRRDRVSGAVLVRRMLKGVGLYEVLLLLIWCVLGGILFGVLGNLVYYMLSEVLNAGGYTAFWWIAAVLAGVPAFVLLLALGAGQALRRGTQKGTLAVLPALGGRIYFGGPHTSDTAAMGLAALRDHGECLLDWLLRLGSTVVLLLTAGPFLAGVSMSAYWMALATELALLAASGIVFAVQSRRKEPSAEEAERVWLAGLARDKELGIVRQPPPSAQALRFPIGIFLPLLLLPPLLLTQMGETQPARWFQLMLLYIPAVLPAGVLSRAAQAGRAAGQILALLPGAGPIRSGRTRLPPEGSVLELKNVTFAYPDRTDAVLSDVDIRLYPGELVGIWGATGSGKSTLARLMAGTLVPNSGNVYYGGIEIARCNPLSIQRRIAWERGEDIRFWEHKPETRDGRTDVVFSTRKEELAGCQRIFILEDGRLTEFQPDEEK